MGRVKFGSPFLRVMGVKIAPTSEKLEKEKVYRVQRYLRTKVQNKKVHMATVAPGQLTFLLQGIIFE